MTKIELIKLINTKVSMAKPIVQRHFTKLLQKRTHRELEQILKTVKVAQDGFDITFRY